MSPTTNCSGSKSIVPAISLFLLLSACGPTVQAQYDADTQQSSNFCQQNAYTKTEQAASARMQAVSNPTDNRIWYGLIGGVIGAYYFDSFMGGAKMGLLAADMTASSTPTAPVPMSEGEANAMFNNIYATCMNTEVAKLNNAYRRAASYPQNRTYFRFNGRYR
jgi:hypothetical protein